MNLLFTSIEGRKHDAAMLADSSLMQDLNNHAYSTAGHPMCIYGDSAYPLRVHLQGPFKNAVLTPQIYAYNDAMSSVSISVEWLFGDIINYFKFLDLKFQKNLKIGLCSIGKMCIVSALLQNSLTCLHSNQTATFLSCEPPGLFDYFA